MGKNYNILRQLGVPPASSDCIDRSIADNQDLLGDSPNIAVENMEHKAMAPFPSITITGKNDNSVHIIMDDEVSVYTNEPQKPDGISKNRARLLNSFGPCLETP